MFSFAGRFGYYDDDDCLEFDSEENVTMGASVDFGQPVLTDESYMIPHKFLRRPPFEGEWREPTSSRDHSAVDGQECSINLITEWIRTPYQGS